MNYNDKQYCKDTFTMSHISSVSNKEGLKDKIHEIHNFLRNNGAGYGMNALKVFNIIYGLKQIEENNLLDKVNLKKPECEFSYLLSIANNNDDEKLAELIFKDVLDSIHNSELKEFLFYEIPRNMRGQVFAFLLKEVNNLTRIEKTCNVQLSGKIYEYFIGRDETAISEWGAYFTDRHITQFIFNEIDPTLSPSGEVLSMVDMFGGSGGFTTGYIMHLKDKYNNSIDWTKELSKVHHYDMNEDVIKSAALEFFCLTGEIPDMKNLKYKNSFKDEFMIDNATLNKFHYVVTNPPYGGDKSKKNDMQVKRDKVKNYIKQSMIDITDNEVKTRRQTQLKMLEKQDKQEKHDLDKNKVSVDKCSMRIKKFANEHDLKGNDKESASLILMMELLKKDGTAVGVLKEGVFFNNIYKDIRECLVTNFNVRKVISVPQNQFENTSTKTSIIIFDNTDNKTSTIEFYDLMVEVYEQDVFEEIQDNIVLVENKGDIKSVYKTLKSKATLDDIINNKYWSFNQQDYKINTICAADGYKMIRIGDVCSFLKTSKHCTNIGTEKGKYRLYCSSQKKMLFVDFCEVNTLSVIIGQGGNFNVHIDKNFTPSKHVCVIQCDNIPLLKYIYYMLPYIQSSFITNTTTISWFNKKNIKDVQIPVPCDEQKLVNWIEKISSSSSIDNIVETLAREAIRK